MQRDCRQTVRASGRWMPQTKATISVGGMLRRCYDDVMIYPPFSLPGLGHSHDCLCTPLKKYFSRFVSRGTAYASIADSWRTIKTVRKLKATKVTEGHSRERPRATAKKQTDQKRSPHRSSGWQANTNGVPIFLAR